MTKTSGHINPFFVEIIIILLFFTIAAAVTLNLFARSHLCSTESTQLTTSISAAQTAAEIMLSHAESGELSEGTAEIYFDESGSVVSGEGDYFYVAEVNTEKLRAGLAHCIVSVCACESSFTPYVLELDISSPGL